MRRYPAASTTGKLAVEAVIGEPVSACEFPVRQPIILGGGTRVPVSVSPQEGFLHEKSLTDTLGFDEPEPSANSADAFSTQPRTVMDDAR